MVKYERGGHCMGMKDDRYEGIKEGGGINLMRRFERDDTGMCA